MTSTADRLNAALSGRYRIERELGAGGMATVYLAFDEKHDRKVAIKVLKPELAAVLGAERFVVEIKTTAAMSHPHILPLFDSGTADGFLFYVMPYIQGETIREKLNRETQFGVDEAVRIAREVADALDYAHRHGVIHRDIKPENILLHDGRAMVMDFGIALAVSAAAGGRMTETGLSLGTPHYMSPEQATADKQITARSDVYALASVLYEMLTGEPPHMGTSAQQIIMKIIAEPVKPATELRKSVPSNVEAALAKALEKLPADRFDSAKAFADALANSAFVHGSVATASAAHVRRARLRDPVFLGVATLTVLFATLAAWGWLRQDGRSGAVVRYGLSIPDGEEVAGWGRRLALTPDGTRLVYVGETSRHTRPLMVRPRDQLHATPLAGTEGAEMPFVSPDGERVGFFGPRGTIRVVPMVGGDPVRLVDSLVGFAGATWGPDGYVYSDGKGYAALVRVRVAGGVAAPFTTLDSTTGEQDHVWPEALPNGKGVLFIVKYAGPTESSLAVADVATGRHRVLAENALYATYVASGFVIYVTRQGTLMAQRFDQGSLTVSGTPFLVDEKISIGSGSAVPDFTPELVLSSSGTLMYFANTGLRDSTDVVWVDRNGSVRIVDPAWTDQIGQGVELSPDGRRVAYPSAGQVWVKELDRGPRRKLTFDGGNRPAWSADGKQIMYSNFVTATGTSSSPNVYSVRSADGTGAATVMRLSTVQVLEANMSADGKWITYRQGGGGESDLYARRTQGDTPPIPLVVSPDQETQGTLSRDSRWFAYTTLESGRPEVWVRTFPDVESGRWKVSPSGGQEPRWAHSGRELFFRNIAGDMVSVSIGGASTFTYGDPKVLFSASNFVSAIVRRMYDVTADDQRFIMVRRLVQRPTEELIVVENFPAALLAKASR